MISRFLKISMVFSAILFAQCADERFNVYDPNYIGDYRLDVEWDNLQSNPEVFHLYRMTFKQGKDQFNDFSVTSSPAGFIDKAFFKDSSDNSSFAFYFVKEGTFTLKVTATSPNEQTTIVDSTTITVNTPFTLMGDTTPETGNNESYTIKYSGKFISSSPAVKYVAWSLDGVEKGIFAVSQPYTFAVSSPAELCLSLIDQRNNRLDGNCYSIVPQKTMGKITFVPDRDTLYSAVNSVISLNVTPGFSKYLWKIGSKDTMTAAANIEKLFFTSMGAPVKVLVAGVDSSEIHSNTDSVLIVPKLFSYPISWVKELADTVHADSLNWQIQGENDSVAAIKGALYHWAIIDTVTGAILVDTVGAKLKSLKYTPARDISLKCTVVLKDSSGVYTSAVLVSTVWATRYRPIVTITADNSTLYTRQSLKITTNAGDIAPGRVIRMFIRVGTSSVDTVLSDRFTFTRMFAEPGVYAIKAWAKDNDSLLSDTAQITVTVIAAAPKIDSLVIRPQMIYAHKPCTLKVAASVSVAQTPIVKTMWDFDGDSSNGVDTITSGVVLVKTFSITGPQKISCSVVDTFGNYSALFRDTVIIRSGKPDALSLSFGPKNVFINEFVRCSLTVSDEDGVIGNYGFSFDDGQTWDIGDNRTVAHSFSVEGKKYIRAFGIDDNGLPSDTLRDSLIVYAGKPLVDSVSIVGNSDNLYYVNQDIKVMVFAHDSNTTGKLTEYTVYAKKGNDIQIFRSSGSLVTLKFPPEKAGVYVLSAYVTDNDNLVSSVYNFPATIEIAPGKPTVQGIDPDTVWVADEVTYTITASDPNGTIRNISIDWGDNLNDNVVVDGQSVNKTIKHKYRDTGLGSYTVVVVATDNDGLKSEQLVHKIVVRKGMPSLSIYGQGADASGDTLYAADRGSDSIFINLFASDSNGAVKRFYLDMSAPFDTLSAQKFNESRFVCKWDVAGRAYPALKDTTVKAVAYCIDDDGFIAADTFYLYFDKLRVPDFEIRFPWPDEEVGSSLDMVWRTNLDPRDQWNTEFRVVCEDLSGRVVGAVELMPWTKAKNMTNNPTLLDNVYDLFVTVNLSRFTYWSDLRLTVEVRDRQNTVKRETVEVIYK